MAGLGIRDYRVHGSFPDKIARAEGDRKKRCLANGLRAIEYFRIPTNVSPERFSIDVATFRITLVPDNVCIHRRL